jgi:hypothetical protein
MIELNDNRTITHLKVLKVWCKGQQFSNCFKIPTSITKLGHFGYDDKPLASSPFLEHTTT